MQVAEGNEQAFKQLFDQYQPRLYAFLMKLSDSKEMAEDTVHDVFLKLWVNRDKLTAIDNFEAYLFTTARNHAFNGLRRMATETLVLAELSNRDSLLPEEPASAFNRQEVREFIRQTVDKLTPKQREVFLLSRDLGLKQEEIAERLSISVSTVKSHLTDALNFLRAEISTRYGKYAVALFILCLSGPGKNFI